MTTPTTIALDIAKSSFQVHGVAASGRTTLRRKLKRGQVLEFFANLPPCVIGMEACGGAHYWARALTGLGHEVRLMPPQYVKPYVKTNKHDAADAEGCCEAVQRPSMRFVPIKSESQQALLMLHRIRDRLVAERTGTISAVRGHMAEFGIVAARRGPGMKELLAIISDLDDARLPPMARELLVLQVEHLRAIETRIAALDEGLQRQARSDEAAKRLTAIPGIGPVIATAMVATVVDAHTFPSGRSFAAWLGLTPRQHATGGRERLLGISKRGDGYLRRQLMHGARSLVRLAAGRKGRFWTGSTAWSPAGPSTSWWLRWPTSSRASSGRCCDAMSYTGRPPDRLRSTRAFQALMWPSLSDVGATFHELRRVL